MKKKIIFLSLTILALAALFSSCERLRCIEGNDIIITEEREVSSFLGVVIIGSFEVEIVYDTVQGVEISTDENLLAYIDTRVSGNNLIIEQATNRCLRSRSPIMITVFTDVLREAEMDGDGMIRCYDWYSDYLRLELIDAGDIVFRNLDVLDVQAYLSGSGMIELEGIADEATFVVEGSGDIRAFRLPVYECYAEIEGPGNISCNVVDYLDAVIDGSGYIYVKGNPIIRSSIRGTGDIVLSK